MFRLGELFSGPGGLAYGAVNADIGSEDFRIVHAWANDYDESTCRTYAHNICHNEEDKSVWCGDVRELDISKDNPFFQKHPFDAFAFGFPCNDFSTVGEQKGFNGTYGPLYSYGVKILRTFQPRWFLAENVSGLSSANKGGAFPKILKELCQAGYRLYPHLYKFEEYGVPQTRHRIIIIGIRKDEPYNFRPPSPMPYRNEDISALNALTNPPIENDTANNERSHMTVHVRERLSFIKPGQNAFNADLPVYYQLNVNGATLSQIYRRLDPDKPSYTVTGSGGGGTHIYHWSENRALTNRERARLQSFPDEYQFIGSMGAVRRQIGMAVPPKAAKIIFEAVLRTFAGINYESVPCNININTLLPDYCEQNLFSGGNCSERAI